MTAQTRKQKPSRWPIAFYGDDFTGSSENMAQFHRHGLKTFMFLDTPSPAAFAERARECHVVGIAGIARSLSPERMVAEVEPVFRLFAEAGLRFVQYKLCSTFDSSSTTGNLATIVTLARRAFPDCFVPVFAATPEFGRYTAFAQHFARFGTDVFRLDRHPTMSRHPVTPMRESDLREVLREQGCRGTGLVDLRAIGAGIQEARRRLEEERGKTAAPILFDATADDHCALVAELLWQVGADEPVVALAAQGLAYGLGRYLRGHPTAEEPLVQALAPVEKLLVLSGSCAPQTERQIRAFERAGAELVRLKASEVIDPARRRQALEAAVVTTAAALEQGRSVCVFTALGPDDPDTPALSAAAAGLCLEVGSLSHQVGSGLAEIAAAAVERYRLPRIVFAGGDTSSYAVRSLGMDGLTVSSGDYASSAHVFRLAGRGPLDGLEIALKGGQVGNDDFFIRLRDGRGASLDAAAGRTGCG